MENTDESVSAPSLLMLHEYCHLDIFNFLELHDSIQLAATNRRLRFVADRHFKKYAKFHLDSSIINKGDEYIDSVFSNIGKHISSLNIECPGQYSTAHLSLNKILEIIDKCENLKHLRINNWQGKSRKSPSLYHFDNVQMLSLRECRSAFALNVLKNFYNLKNLNIETSKKYQIQSQKLKAVLENNPNLASFVYYYKESNTLENIYFNYKLLELIPNVETLCVCVNKFASLEHINSLVQLNRLTKLRLDCYRNNINLFLQELAKKGILEELELSWVEVNDGLFKILSSFEKLHLLVIRAVCVASTIALPKSIKRLRLTAFSLTLNCFLEIIQQLKDLEKLDLQLSSVEIHKKPYFDEVKELSRQIVHVIGNQRRQCLDVVLPWNMKLSEEHLSNTCLVDTKHFRFLRYTKEWDPLEIKISFPGFR